MNLIPVKTPLLLKWLFPNYVWNMPREEKSLYLTFDDGPSPEVTSWTLACLKAYNAKATFFCTGNNVEQYPENFKDIVKDGHAVGNHSYSHPNGWRTDSEQYVDQVIKTQNCIEKEISQIECQTRHNSLSKLFRPPYGRITPSQGKKLLALRYKIVMWDVLAFDWKEDITPEHCAKNVISKADNGSIIVFHDSHKAAKNMMHALPLVLQHFSEAGFNFKPLQ